MAFGMAEELSREDQRFLKERAPRLLQVIEEAKERNFDEVVEEAMERVGELQDEWREAREDGEEWAGLMVGEMANEAALDYLVWKFEEGEIEEGKAEETLRDLMEERWRIENGITEREMKMAEVDGNADLTAELAEELTWRKENPRKAVNEMIEEFLEELEELGEEGEERAIVMLEDPTDRTFREILLSQSCSCEKCGKTYPTRHDQAVAQQERRGDLSCNRFAVRRS